jgi:hypothetical protein
MNNNNAAKKKKKLYLLLIVLIFMLATLSHRFFYRSIDLKQYQNIESGMSREQVDRILGSPVKVSKHSCTCHGRTEIWRYNIKFSLLAVTVWFRDSADGSMVVFDKVWGFIPQ